MRRHYPTMSLMVFAAIGLLAGGCGGGHKTPDDVFKAAKTSVEKEDWKGFSDCLTEDSRDTMAGGLVFVAVMMKGFSAMGGDDAKAKLKPLDEVLTKHGLTEDVMKKMSDEKPVGKDPESIKKAMKKMVEPIKDKGAFFGDMWTAMKKLDESKKDNSPFPKDAELKDVKIEGDTAKGVMVSTKAGKENRVPIEFRKVGGSWKIEIPMDPAKG